MTGFKQLKLLFVYRPVILSPLLSVDLGSDRSRRRFGVGDAQDPELESESTIVDCTHLENCFRDSWLSSGGIACTANEETLVFGSIVALNFPKQ